MGLRGLRTTTSEIKMEESVLHHHAESRWCTVQYRSNVYSLYMRAYFMCCIFKFIIYIHIYAHSFHYFLIIKNNHVKIKKNTASKGQYYIFTAHTVHC